MRTDKEIFDQTNKIARIIYDSMGYSVNEGFDFYSERVNRHPQERMCWSAACSIQLLMTDTDVNDAIVAMEDEGEL